MSDLPKTQRVRILDGKRAGEVGLFEKTYPDGMSSILINGSQVAFCRQYVVLTAREEAELIAKARGNDPEQQAESNSFDATELKKRRGRQTGSKNKPNPDAYRALEERPPEESQPEPMTTVPAGDKPYHITHGATPVVGRVEQLEVTQSKTVPMAVNVTAGDVNLATVNVTHATTPLLIIVQPDGTTILSTPVHKDNVTSIIRSLIDLTEGDTTA